MNKLIIIIFFMLSAPAHAYYLDINLSSVHLKEKVSGEDHNEQNYGLGIAAEYLTFGFYKNSFNKTSLYFGGYNETNHERFNIGVFYGVVTGYKAKVDSGVLLVLMPYATIGSKDYRIKIGATPNVITLQMQFGF